MLSWKELKTRVGDPFIFHYYSGIQKHSDEFDKNMPLFHIAKKYCPIVSWKFYIYVALKLAS